MLLSKVELPEKLNDRLVLSECGDGGIIKIGGLSAAKKLSGCTVVRGSIKMEMRAGPSKLSCLFRANRCVLCSERQHFNGRAKTLKMKY